MKKQALAFFTMFSLILMLSIYYITLPKEANTSKKSESVISTLEKDSKENKEDESDNNNQVLSDPNASEDEKEEALSENEQLKNNVKLEKECTSLIKKLGYKSSVEIKDKTLYVSVLEEAGSDEVASTIMKTLYKKYKNAYFIEVSFT